ncbi:MAG TPA: hypothetical protein VFL17_11885 [Anaerolineae bacterium]|nr:hypothetical protein [Anaerolineae bacterium]
MDDEELRLFGQLPDALHRDEANTLPDRIIQAGYRSPFTTLAELL